MAKWKSISLSFVSLLIVVCLPLIAQPKKETTKKHGHHGKGAISEPVYFHLKDCNPRSIDIQDGVPEDSDPDSKVRFCYRIHLYNPPAGLDKVTVTWKKADGTEITTDELTATNKDSSCQCDTEARSVVLHAIGKDADVRREICEP